jgi:hypothetical protein
MLALADMLDLFPDELARLSRRGLALTLRPASPLQRLLLRHRILLQRRIGRMQ